MPTPRHPGEISCEWMTAALRTGGVLPRGAVTQLHAARIGEAFGFLSCVAHHDEVRRIGFGVIQARQTHGDGRRHFAIGGSELRRARRPRSTRAVLPP